MMGCWDDRVLAWRVEGWRVEGWRVAGWLAHGQRMTPLVKRPGTTTSSPSASTMERRELRRESSAIFKTELNCKASRSQASRGQAWRSQAWRRQAMRAARRALGRRRSGTWVGAVRRRGYRRWRVSSVLDFSVLIRKAATAIATGLLQCNLITCI